MQWLAGRHILVVGEGTTVEAVADRLRARGAAAIVRAATPAEAEVARTFDEAEAKLGGPIELLVHAGLRPAEQAALDMTMDDWRAALSADLDSRFLAAAEFARRRLGAAGPGAILLLLPVGSVGAAPATAAGALDNLVKSLAVEWARDGIRINAVASGVLHSHAPDQAALASLGLLAAYALSDYAAYLTGTVMGLAPGDT